MSDVSVSIPENLKEYLDNQVSQGGYENAGEYLAHLVREDWMRNAREEIETLLIESLDSGPGIEATSEWWDGFQSKLAARVHTSETG